MRPLRNGPALLPRQPVPRETRPRLNTYDPSSTQARRKLMTDSAVTTYDQHSVRERSPRMYPASRGVPLTSCRAAGCPASENEAQEPRTLLRLCKRGLGPSLGVCWRGFPQLTCLSARQRASAGPFRSQAVERRQFQPAARVDRRFRVEAASDQLTGVAAFPTNSSEGYGKGLYARTQMMHNLVTL